MTRHPRLIDAARPCYCRDYVLNPHNQAALDNVLTYHVASGAIASNQLYNGEKIPTVDAGLKLNVSTGTRRRQFQLQHSPCAGVLQLHFQVASHYHAVCCCLTTGCRCPSTARP